MTGKQIAENLRNNRERWTRYAYYRDGAYCVIGLKLHELRVPVEDWPSESDTPIRQGGIIDLFPGSVEIDPQGLLGQLQRANDNSRSVDGVIAFAEAHANTDFPLEALAEALR